MTTKKQTPKKKAATSPAPAPVDDPKWSGLLPSVRSGYYDEQHPRTPPFLTEILGRLGRAGLPEEMMPLTAPPSPTEPRAKHDETPALQTRPAAAADAWHDQFAVGLRFDYYEAGRRVTVEITALRKSGAHATLDLKVVDDSYNTREGLETGSQFTVSRGASGRGCPWQASPEGTWEKRCSTRASGPRAPHRRFLPVFSDAVESSKFAPLLSEAPTQNDNLEPPFHVDDVVTRDVREAPEASTDELDGLPVPPVLSGRDKTV